MTTALNVWQYFSSTIYSSEYLFDSFSRLYDIRRVSEAIFRNSITRVNSFAVTQVSITLCGRKTAVVFFAIYAFLRYIITFLFSSVIFSVTCDNDLKSTRTCICRFSATKRVSACLYRIRRSKTYKINNKHIEKAIPAYDGCTVCKHSFRLFIFIYLFYFIYIFFFYGVSYNVIQ